MLGDPGEHLIGSFDDDPTLAHKVASAEHRERIVRERRRHIGTVRSAAGSRNQPHRRIAWLLVVVLIVLAALVARLDAAPAAASVALARQYADALTGADRDEPARAGPRGWPGDEDLADRSAGLGARAASAGEASAERPRGRGDDDGDPNDNAPDDNAPDDDEADDESSDRRRGDADRHNAGQPGDEPRPIGTLAGFSERSVVSADATDPLVDDDDRDAADASGGTTGELAQRDAEQSPPDAALSSDAGAASAHAGAAEMYEAWMRRIRPAWWGRLDFGVAWRQRWSEPRYAPPTLHHELWLVATWRR